MYRHGTVTAAASSINMTQPAASALLRDMESRLGFALFSRMNRRLRLTSQGHALMPEVFNALAGIEAVDKLAGDIRQGATTRLVIGAVAITASSLLPAGLACMRQKHPDVAVTLRAGTALEIIEMAVDHRIDMGIIVSAEECQKRVASSKLAPLSLCAVMRDDHPWARRPALSLEMVVNSRPIVLGTALPAGRATKEEIEMRGLPYRPLIEVAQSSAACALAAEGLGVAIVESLGARYAERQGLVSRQLLTLNSLSLMMVWPQDRVMSAAAESLLLCMTTEAKNRL